jgi:phosphoribosylanthranilate isomerase
MALPLAGPDGRLVVKICGMRRVADVQAAKQARADLIGLIFAPSRRQVTPAVALDLLIAVPGHPPAVGVFVDLLAAAINEVASKVRLAAVQLSGRESPEEAALIALPYIKAIHLTPSMTAPLALQIMDSYPGAAAFLLDSPSDLGGGSGTVADWDLAAEIIAAATKPVLLAGGLDPTNVGEALLRTGAQGVDVSSGVEAGSWKDATLIRQFVEAARADAH